MSAGALLGPRTARAQGPEGGTEPPQTALEAEAFLSGPSVILDRNVNGDVFALGQNVTINSNVDGSLFIIADQALIRGKVSGSVYALATNLNLDAPSVLERSAYLGAISLITAKGASIQRDLYLIAVGAQLRGTVQGTTQAIVGPAEIVRLVMTRIESLGVFSSAPAPPLTPTNAMTLPTRGLQAFECPRPIARAVSVRLTSFPLTADCTGPAAPALAQPAADPLQDAGTWALNRLRDFILLGVIGLILILGFPRRLDQWSESLSARPLLSGGAGLLVALNGVLLIVALAAGIALIGFALNWIGLGALSTLIWGLGFSLVAVGFWFFVLFLLYISQVLVAYWGSSSILKRLAPSTLRHPIVPLAIGLVILVLLFSIPTLGPIIGILSALVGAGAIALSWASRRSTPRADETTLAVNA